MQNTLGEKLQHHLKTLPGPGCFEKSGFSPRYLGEKRENPLKTTNGPGCFEKVVLRPARPREGPDRDRRAALSAAKQRESERGEEVKGPDRGHNPRRRAIHPNLRVFGGFHATWETFCVCKNSLHCAFFAGFWWFLTCSHCHFFCGAKKVRMFYNAKHARCCPVLKPGCSTEVLAHVKLLCRSQ